MTMWHISIVLPTLPGDGCRAEGPWADRPD